MEVIEGKILSVKTKTNKSDENYEGVTLRGTDGKRYWFGNYGASLIGARREIIRVSAGSTGAGNGITFLNGIEKVERLGMEKDAAAPPVRSPVTPPVSAAPVRPGAQIAEPVHRVAESAEPLGTLDDLAEGTDPSRYGGVIIFRKGATKAEVEFLLRAMEGVLDRADIREYDAKKGSPEFYIP